MSTSQIFIISAMVLCGTFLGIMSIFDLPQSVAGWVISDIILAAYLGYLFITFIRGKSKTKVEHSSRRVTV